MSCTVVEWLPVFIHPYAVQVLLDCWSYQRNHVDFRLYGYVVFENHLQRHHADKILDKMRSNKKAHKKDREYQLWQEGTQPGFIFSEKIMLEKLDHIHFYSIKRGYVNLPELGGIPVLDSMKV